VNPGQIYDEINETFNDWDGLLANPRFARVDDLVAWTNFTGGRLKDPITIERILDVVQTGQFTFQSAEDGSIFQLLYSFGSDGKLEVARLAFYLLQTRGSFEEGTAELISNSWIRIDYDLSTAKGVLHNDCHLHLYGFPESRIMVDSVPGPRQFVEFVISACYPDFYKVHRLNESGDFAKPKAIEQVNACVLVTGSKPGPMLIHLATPK